MYGCPIALGAIAFPTKPASNTTVSMYGSACINWTGISPIAGSSTPWSLIWRASVNPKSKQAI